MFDRNREEIVIVSSKYFFQLGRVKNIFKV